MVSWIYSEFRIWTGVTLMHQKWSERGKNGPSNPGAPLTGVIDSSDDLLQPTHRWLAQIARGASGEHFEIASFFFEVMFLLWVYNFIYSYRD